MEPQRLLSDVTLPEPRTVLVVDDDKATCLLLAEWVRMLGCNAEVAYGADQALEILRSRAVNVALCDICMPGHDGIWLIERVRQDFPTTAVVIVTGLTRMDPAVTLAPCVTGYVTKPFDFEDVAAALRNACAAIVDGYRQ